MKDKKRFYRLCVAIVLVVAVLAVFVLDLPSEKKIPADQTGKALSDNVTGDVSILRNGSSYTLKNNIDLKQGDGIFTGDDSYCSISYTGVLIVSLDENTSVEIGDTKEGATILKTGEGVAFFSCFGAEGRNTVSLGDTGAELIPQSNAVFSIESYPGTQTVNLYSGRAELKCSGETMLIEAGERVVLIQDEEGETSLFEAVLKASDLREYLLRELIDRGGLCFETADIEMILARRMEEAGKKDEDGPKDVLTCTIEIRCDTLVKRLPEGVKVPPGSTVLAAIPVKFTSGDTVFDVTKRVCRTAGIELEYKYVVAVIGYKVTGIGGMKEGLYGDPSGWMYKVNGWFPNYSASRYDLKDGDTIVWVYTCDGGPDVGQERWEK